MASEPVSILVVDDRADNRLALRAILSRPDYEFQEAASGTEALRLLLAREFAVLLLDVVMPGMNGFELASAIRQRERAASTPIIFMSAEVGDLEGIYRGYREGAVDYLTKPLIPEMVRAKVEVFAQLYRQRRRIERQSRALLDAQKREAEAAILELRLAAERRYRHLANSIPGILFTADATGNVDYFNRRWFEYTGFSAAQSSSWLLATNAEDRVAMEKSWKARLREGLPFEIEVRIRRADGEYRWHLCRAVPEPGRNGKAASWVATLTDITERKAAELERERLLRDALDAVRARDEFLSIASHELRTPLASLQLQLEMLLHPPRLAPPMTPDRLEKKLATAARQVERLARLVSELLDVTRIAAGRMKLETEDVDLAHVAEDVVSRFHADAVKAGSEVSLDAPAPVQGRWDRSRIEQVLTNLLGNALKFGAGKPIEISVHPEDASARIVVRDHGVGIPKSAMTRIFERFERAQSSSSYGGLGLGLYIARQIVESHGGTISVSSTEGDGATFVIALPRSSRAEVGAKPLEGTAHGERGSEEARLDH